MKLEKQIAKLEKLTRKINRELAKEDCRIHKLDKWHDQIREIFSLGELYHPLHVLLHGIIVDFDFHSFEQLYNFCENSFNHRDESLDSFLDHVNDIESGQAKYRNTELLFNVTVEDGKFFAKFFLMADAECCKVIFEYI